MVFGRINHARTPQKFRKVVDFKVRGRNELAYHCKGHGNSYHQVRSGSS